MMPKNQKRPSIQIHPRARVPFECIAAVLPAVPMGAPRAIKEQNRLAVFSGFAGLGQNWEIRPAIEQNLSDAEIEAAAWMDVEAIWHLLSAATEPKKAVADMLAAAAPIEVLTRLGLPDQRDPMRARRALRVAAEGGVPRTAPTLFERRKAFYEKQQARLRSRL